MKKITFLGDSLEALKSFPLSAKREAGYQLDKVQHGFEPNDWKPMSSIGNGVSEIRVRDSSGIFRVMYVAKLESTVYVLHAFNKKTQKTSKKDIELTKKRLKTIVDK
jgi:phage-related protein